MNLPLLNLRLLVASAALAVPACSNAEEQSEAGTKAQQLAQTGPAAQADWEKKLAAATNQELAQIFTDLDSNHDMKLSGAELEPMGPKVAEFDGNGDGEIAILEFSYAAAAKQAAARGKPGVDQVYPRRPTPPVAQGGFLAELAAMNNQQMAQRFTDLDANGDMKLSGAELAPIGPQLAAFDNNGDGEVELVEFGSASADARAAARALSGADPGASAPATPPPPRAR